MHHVASLTNGHSIYLSVSHPPVSSRVMRRSGACTRCWKGTQLPTLACLPRLTYGINEGESDETKPAGGESSRV
jgi:hypothetical protein